MTIYANYTIPILIGVFGLLSCLFLLIFVVIIKKKKPKIKVNEEFINQLTQALGSKENILNVKMINGRIHFEMNDLENVDFEKLKQLSTAGVFVTNQTIKMLFSYDSEAICKALSK